MANNWLIEQTIDLQHGVQAPLVWPNALMLCGDNNAHTWRVTVMDGGEAAQVTGSVMGYFVRPDGNTVAVQGSMTGNVASVVLAQACYAQEGDVKAVMRLSSGTGAKVTLAALILPVRNVLTDSIIDPGEVIPSLDELLAQSDLVSLHCPLNESSKGLIGKENIAKMKQGALLINAARGPVVDSQALADALNSGYLGGAGIDVFEVEPPLSADHPLLHSKNTIVTPHVAFASAESMEERCKIVFDSLQQWIAGRQITVIL